VHSRGQEFARACGRALRLAPQNFLVHLLPTPVNAHSRFNSRKAPSVLFAPSNSLKLFNSDRVTPPLPALKASLNLLPFLAFSFSLTLSRTPRFIPAVLLLALPHCLPALFLASASPIFGHALPCSSTLPSRQSPHSLPPYSSAITSLFARLPSSSCIRRPCARSRSNFRFSSRLNRAVRTLALSCSRQNSLEPFNSDRKTRPPTLS
jgi:hypothetical protein